jgi:hypothetical protein
MKLLLPLIPLMILAAACGDSEPPSPPSVDDRPELRVHGNGAAPGMGGYVTLVKVGGERIGGPVESLWAPCARVVRSRVYSEYWLATVEVTPDLKAEVATFGAGTTIQARPATADCPT